MLVTIDCDGQHQPRLIPSFVEACQDCDIVSGSRYLAPLEGNSQPPADRRRINEMLTARLNQLLGLSITDAFCGFKAYRVSTLARFDITETGYAMPLEVWVQAAHFGLRIRELAVPLLYLDLARSFGGALDDAADAAGPLRGRVAGCAARASTSCQSPHARSLCGERTG